MEGFSTLLSEIYLHNLTYKWFHAIEQLLIGIVHFFEAFATAINFSIEDIFENGLVQLSN